MALSRKITFEFDEQKFVNAAAYLVERCPDVTKMKLAKLLFFADALHLKTWGRPIIGDQYVKMEYGPVPSNGYNLIKRDERAAIEAQVLFDHYLSVNGNDIVLKQKANLDYLAETDREALDAICSKFGPLSASQLSKLSHRENAWQKAEMNGELDYRLLFGSTAESTYQLAQEDQLVRDLLSEMSLQEFLEPERV